MSTTATPAFDLDVPLHAPELYQPERNASSVETLADIGPAEIEIGRAHV